MVRDATALSCGARRGAGCVSRIDRIPGRAHYPPPWNRMRPAGRERRRVMETLPRPEVLRRYTDTACQPPLPALRLRWDGSALGFGERLWYLPENVCLSGPAPERFGVRIERHG